MAASVLIVPLVVAALAVTGLVLWLAIRSVTFTTFLCGGFFVSSGTLLYLWAAGVSVPVIGTGIVLAPEAHLTRGAIHGVLLLVSLTSLVVRRPTPAVCRKSHAVRVEACLDHAPTRHHQERVHMLARTWKTTVDVARTDEYEAFAHDVSLPMFRAAPGCLAVLMTRKDDDCSVLTVWEDIDCIAALERSDRYRETVANIVASGFLGPAQTTETLPLHAAWSQAIHAEQGADCVPEEPARP